MSPQASGHVREHAKTRDGFRTSSNICLLPDDLARTPGVRFIQLYPWLDRSPGGLQKYIGVSAAGLTDRPTLGR